MGIAWFRDLVICIFGLAATLSIVFVAVLAFMVYRQLRPVIKSIKATARRVEDITSSVESEIFKPLAQVAAFIQGIRESMKWVRRFTQKREENGDE
jgi:hypothetical protein